MRWTKDTKKARLEAEAAAGRDELNAALELAEKEIEALKYKITLMEQDKAAHNAALQLRDDEIAMLKSKLKAQDNKIATLFDEGFVKGVADKDKVVAALMAKYFQMCQGAFLEKCDAILKAWKYGSFGYMFSCWKSFVNASKTPQEGTANTIAELQAALAAANARIAKLEPQVTSLETTIEQNARDHADMVKKLEGQVTDLQQHLAAAQAALEAEKQKHADDVEHLNAQHAIKLKELELAVETAQATEAQALLDAKTAQQQKLDAEHALPRRRRN